MTDKPKKVSLNGNETKVLEALVAQTRPEGEMCVAFAYLMGETNLDRPTVRRACRSLARKGLAEFYRGLTNDDGEMAGSGYCASRAGVDLIEPEEDDEQEPLGL